MSVRPTTRRTVTISDHSSATASRVPSLVGNAPTVQKDLHPLPPIHLDAQDTTPQGFQKKLLDMYEAIRSRTDAMSKNPLTAPAYEKRIPFVNNTGNAAYVQVTFKHSLGRAPTHGVTPFHSENAPYQGYSVDNPNGEDPAQYQTVKTWVPANTTAYHSFILSAD